MASFHKAAAITQMLHLHVPIHSISRSTICVLPFVMPGASAGTRSPVVRRRAKGVETGPPLRFRVESVRRFVPLADRLYDEHLRELKDEGAIQ